MAEAVAELSAYRTSVTLRDGAHVSLRPMTPQDCEALATLFATATADDVRYLRDDIRDPAVARSWCASRDYLRVFPVMALSGGRAVGQASLHFGCGPERHCGKVRIFVADDFRRRGLGSHMLQALVGVARQRGLHLLLAEIVSEQTGVIRTFMKAGFELCYTLDDYFMLPDGETRGVALLKLCLRPPCDELGEFTGDYR